MLKNESTEEAQMARIEALKGKKMLFVAGNFMYPACHPSLVDHLKMMRDYGVEIHAVFQQDKLDCKYYQAAKDGECFDYELFADIGSEKGGENVVKVVLEKGLVFDGVWSPHETTQNIVSIIQEKLPGCSGNKTEAYEIAQDKYATRKALENANLNTIKAVQIWTLDDVSKASEYVGFPMIIKPTVGMGSSGVYKAETKEELTQVVKRLLDDIKTNWVLNRNAIGKQAPILAESFITPIIFGGKTSEFDVDCLFWDGELKYANVVDNWEPLPPYFQELASSAPSLTSKEIQQEIIQYCGDCVKALGFVQGGFHMECWYTETGPVLIECNPRIGGGATVQTHQNCWGVNPMFEFNLTALGIPINPPRSLEPICNYGLLLPNAQRTGKLSDKVSFLEKAKESDMCVEATYLKKGGDVIKGRDLHVPDWLGELHFKHDGTLHEMVTHMTHHLHIAQTLSNEQTEILDQPQED